MALIILSVVFATFLGFAAHRCGVCGVKAVAEVLTTGRAFMFLSFGKIVLWVVASAILLSALGLAENDPLIGYSVSARVLAGGLLFGIGAAINRGCAFSTLTHLGSGDLEYSATLVGFAAGTGLYLVTESALPTADVVLHWTPLAAPKGWRLPLAVVVWSWAGWELWRLLGKKSAAETWAERLFARRYRLSTGAALIGVSNAFLFTVHGSWAYTGALAKTVEGIVASRQGATAVSVLLAMALMLGIVFSAVQSGRFRLRLPRPHIWVMHFGGGAVMGLGTALVPGGNFVLILHGIPVLSPHALPAFTALVVGIALSLLVMRAVTGQVVRIDCGNDICRD